MTATAEHPDHSAEALELLAYAEECRIATDEDPQVQPRIEALVRSNLAIAQGHERVAEAIEGLKQSSTSPYTGDIEGPIAELVKLPEISISISGAPVELIDGKVTRVCRVCHGPIEGADGPECDPTGCPERDGASSTGGRF